MPRLVSPQKEIEEIAARYCPLDKKDFFFVQVGANDGVYDDPLVDYIVEFGWKGILVEPVPELFKKLLNTYKDTPGLIFENVAIDQTDGSRPFYSLRISEGDPSTFWYGLVGSFIKEKVVANRHLIPDFDRRFITQNINCISLQTLFTKHNVLWLDLLCIDAEGYDFEIIKSIPFSNVKPRMLIFEHQHLSASDLLACKQLLKTHGYEMLWVEKDAFAYLT